jgi:membrane associated rhomboid family serine protease
MKPVARTATNVLSAVIALAWVLALLSGMDDQIALMLGFIPARLSGVEVPWSAVPALLTPLSATLVHSGPLHIVFNLIVFLWCGAAVERVLGRSNLLILFVVGAYVAAIAQWATDLRAVTPMVGASGAISAIMGAFALSFGRPKPFTKSFTLNRWINIAWLLAAWVVLQLMMSWLMGGQGYLLATPAHIGGFAAGLLLQRPLLLWRYRTA